MPFSNTELEIKMQEILRRALRYDNLSLNALQESSILQESRAIRTRNWFLYGNPNGPAKTIIFRRWNPYNIEE